MIKALIEPLLPIVGLTPAKVKSNVDVDVIVNGNVFWQEFASVTVATYEPSVKLLNV